MSGRSSHASAILGQDLFSRLPQTKVLLVGAGGIGCELCACILSSILTPFLTHDNPFFACAFSTYSEKHRPHRIWRHHSPRPRHDRPLQSQPPIPFQEKGHQAKQGFGASAFPFSVNCNTEANCIFSAACIMQVAAKTASAFNPNVKITPIHANIKEPQFDVAWFRGFDLVLNSFDNLGKHPSDPLLITALYVCLLYHLAPNSRFCLRHLPLPSAYQRSVTLTAFQLFGAC